MANPATPYVAVDFGLAIPGAVTIQVKTCKSRRHQYYGTNRCPACKKEYDRRYHKNRRMLAKQRKIHGMNRVHVLMYGDAAAMQLALRRAELVTKAAIV